MNPWDDDLNGNEDGYDFFDEPGAVGSAARYFQAEQANIFDIQSETPSMELLQSGSQGNDDEGLDNGARSMYLPRDQDHGRASRAGSIGSIYESLGGTSSSYGDKLYQDYMKTTRRD